MSKVVKPTVKGASAKEAVVKGASEGTVALPAQSGVGASVRLGGASNGRDPFWYRNIGEGDFELVTKEYSNPALGITQIDIFAPSEAQYNNRVIATVKLTTIIGEVTGLQIRESDKVPGSMYIQTASRNIAKEGQPARWINEIKLDRKVQAQILALVDSLVVPA